MVCQAERPELCCVLALFASSESESLGVMVCGGGGASNGFGGAPWLKLGGKESLLAVGEVRNGSDCIRFYHIC